MSVPGSVMDLYASLGLQIDQSSWSKAQKEAYAFHRGMQKRLDNLELPTMQVAKFGDAAKRAGRSIGAAALRVGSMGVAVAGAGMVAAAKDALDFDRIITSLNVSSGGAAGNLDRLRREALRVSDATIVSKEEVVAGAQAYTTLTGDVKTAIDSMEVFSRVAYGQGAQMSDVAATAAALGDQFGITGKDFSQAFSILSAGGKAGAIELSQMAEYTARLASGFKDFGGSQGIGGLATLGAMFQVTAKNFGGDAGETVTGLSGLMVQLQRNAKELRKEGGIKVFEDDGKTLRPLLEIVDDIAAKKFNGEKMFDLIGEAKAVKALSALTSYREEVERIKEAALGANDELTDFRNRKASDSGRVDKEINVAKNAISRAASAKKVADLTEGLGQKVQDNIEFAKEAWGAAKGIASDVADVGSAVADVGKFSLNAVTDPMSVVRSVNAPLSMETLGLKAKPKTAADLRRDDFAALHADNQKQRLQRLAASNPAVAAKAAAAVNAVGGAFMGGAEKVLNVSAAPTVNVYAGNADAEKTAAIVKKVLGNWWSATLREGASGTGGL